MTSFNCFSIKSLAAKTAIAAAAVVACSAASALPSFTFNPAGAGLAGSAFTADNLLISDFATVTSTATGFTETGYLSITGAQLGGANVMSGLGSGYGLFLKFDAVGTNILAPGGAVSYGNLASLTYTLYGYNGPAYSFTPTSAPSLTTSVVLGSGSSTSGTFFGTSMNGTVTSATATVNSATFAKSSTAGTFFTTPASFYNMAAASFTNDLSTISTTSTGFVVNGGGGSLHFVAAAVPEPETYALMLGGLAAVGFVARRRNNG